MTDDKLKLLKRYQYDKRTQYDADEETRTITNYQWVDALDVYEYEGTPYIVSVSWHSTEYGEPRDHSYYRELTLKVYTADAADVDNETKVRAIVADTKGFKYTKSAGPYLLTSYGDDRDENHDPVHLDTRKEEYFTSDLRSRVIRAIEAYLDERK